MVGLGHACRIEVFANLAGKGLRRRPPSNPRR
jgi:hypothetical protein